MGWGDKLVLELTIYDIRAQHLLFISEEKYHYIIVLSDENELLVWDNFLMVNSLEINIK